MFGVRAAATNSGLKITLHFLLISAERKTPQSLKAAKHRNPPFLQKRNNFSSIEKNISLVKMFSNSAMPQNIVFKVK